MFTERKSIEQSYIKSIEFSKQIDSVGTSKQTIYNIYAILREKLRLANHKKWTNHLLGEVVGEGGYAFIEIDESEILGNGHIQYWMLGLID